jgi:hypothetical protein
MDWLSRDLHMQITGGDRMVSVPGEEMGNVSRLTNLICGKQLVHVRNGIHYSQIHATAQTYDTQFRMSDV